MTTDEEDPVDVKMKMYEAQAIVIEKEAEIEELRRRIDEMDRERLERKQGEASSSSREVWAAISQLRGSNALQKQRVEQSGRTSEESMRNIQGSFEPLEQIDKFDRIERRLEEIVARLDRNEAENVQKGMKKLKGASANILEEERNEAEGMKEERTTNEGLLETLLEDRINGRDETILIMGGGRDNLDEMVILDRKTSTWKVLNLKLPCKNNYGGSALLNNEIYIFGGEGLEKKLHKLDSQQMRWIALAEMNEGRRDISNSSLVFQGCIWVFGGWKKYEGALDTVEKYCPERNEWIEMPGMSENRSWGAAAICNEKIFVSGGMDYPTYLKSVECFDPTSGVWAPMVDMPGIRLEHSMISDGSSLFFMGGGDFRISLIFSALVLLFTVSMVPGKKKIEKTVWRIRPSEENAIWEELQPMNESRGTFTANSLCCSTSEYKKEIYAIGGWDGQKSLAGVEIFDGERWREGPKLPNGCDSMSSVVIPLSLAESLLLC